MMMNSAQDRGWFSRLRLQAASAVLVFAVIGGQWAQAQTFKVLHTFHYSDGWSPAGTLVLDAVGNIYGTTGGGGSPNCSWYQQGCGTVFKLNKNGKQLWLHSFNGWNGFGPLAGTLRDKAGNLYGTTTSGGKKTQACGGAQNFGCGLVYKLDASGKETVLHRFTGGSDGQTPEALLIQDSAGNLYGTTLWGGIANDGVVFKVGQAGKYTVLYTFRGGAGGGTDRPGLIWGSPGNLYGVAGYGAYNYGVLFEVNARTGTETVLYNFVGENPAGFGSVLVEDATGNLYGTTEQGGNTKCTYGAGCGVVGELTPHSDGSWTGSVLYTFCSLNNNNCADGAYPAMGALVRDAAGNLYGTTYLGGAANCDGEYLGCGVVFKLDPSGKETILHTFSGGADGAFPCGLTMDASGNLYGTAESGGDLKCQPKYGGCGVVFKITP